MLNAAANSRILQQEPENMFAYILIALVAIPMVWVVVQMFRDDTAEKKTKK